MQIEENLRGLALTLKRDDETQEQALERVKNSKYIIDFKHDEYWPFYDVKHHFGRVILTVNTAHPFFSELYDPVRKIDTSQADGDGGTVGATPTTSKPEPIIALDLLLLSLARTQSRLGDASEENRRLLDALRREWSETYRIQLST